ncbi:dihydrodipicolinate reductase [Lactobacillus gasseri]|uniref:dihydrodipicolinate reductase n=1 Tax=Lactobacillus gasseri TaxID=1596 RepID=UPI001186A3DE|nr:dihydrodipicolinate reductase [Lactobacillus gasseri]
MTKVKTLNVRLNPEKIVDKEILDYFDQSLIPKTTLVKTALIHEIERLKASGDPYVKDNLKASETPKNELDSSSSAKERLQGGFSAFSDKDI